jgi:putative exosortase-associated protein (TIGR04073 family)
MKTLAAVLLSLGLVASASADIQKPPRKGPTYKASVGVAKATYSSAYIADSFYKDTKYHGGTVGFTHGIIEGTTKTIAGTALGVVELLTFPFPPYRELNSAYAYPPADLKTFW